MGKGKNRNAGAGIGGNCKIDEDASPYMLEGERPDKRLASPPGSGSIESFLNLCTGCQICTAACKSQILKPSLTEWGLSGFMQPFMDFSQGFCLHTCHACTKACPTGAIKFLTSKEKLRVNRDGKIQEKFMRCKNRRYRLRSLRGTLPGTGNRDDSFRQT